MQSSIKPLSPFAAQRAGAGSPGAEAPGVSERRSPSSGLPILSTEPLSQYERRCTAELARTFRLLADRLEVLANNGTVAQTLDALQLVSRAGELNNVLAAGLGRGR